MSDLANCTGLAIIGIEISGPDFIDIESYGYQVYRGLNIPVDNNLRETYAADPLQMITKICLQARVRVENVGLVSFQADLVEKVKLSGLKTNDAATQGCDIASAFINTTHWLDSGAVDAVLLLDENLESRSISALLVSHLKYAVDNGKPVLAVISGVAESAVSDNAKSAGTLVLNALKSANETPVSIGLVLTSAPLEIASEINSPEDLITAFPAKNGLGCALADGDAGLLSLVKAVWCLHQRVIPGKNDWQAPSNPEIWINSAFYIPTESRTWFTSTEQPVRFALTIHSTNGKNGSALILREGPSEGLRKNHALRQEAFFIFPVFGNSVDTLLHNLEKFKLELDSQTDLRGYSVRKIDLWQKDVAPDDLIVCILGRSLEELNKEIDFAIRGIPGAIEKGIEWRTPMGSYITPSPLGESGSVSFVYPGAFNSYPGVARDLIFLFPSLYDRLTTISKNLSNLLNEKILYPRSISALSASDLEQAEKNLSADPLAMLISGTSLAAVYTFLLRETFDIHPATSFGYSLGEISMMFATGVWTQADEMSASLRTSPLFRTRLAGPQNAIRENWNLPVKNVSDEDESIWANYVLMALPDTVQMAIKDESRVYITHINTPRQVVIAGDPAACRRVIETLKCNSIQAPFNYALHCLPMQSEFEDLQTLLTWPVSNQPGMTLNSAATYQPMPIEQQAIASQIAHGLCNQLDFPRLVNQAYADGARIFIELGAGSNCSRWVDDSLKDKPHASFSINRKGVDDHTAVLQLIAKLISHHVKVNLSAILD
jgi:PfaB family protein